MRSSILILGFTLLAACAKPPSTPPPAEGETVDRPELSAQECEAKGGTVVGDIGDGAIHQPDYVCPNSGAAPIGTIVADPNGPIGVEGAVCCG